jgi:glycosyltransferase involved in cell wall biosynthesis
MLINAARIGEVGGLRSFVEALACCFGDTKGVTGVVPEGVQLKAGIAQVSTPKWLASSSRVSWFRPILWWIYGAFFFPASFDTRILCSTHHVLPFRKHQVVTVHDIRPYYYPDSWAQYFNFRVLLPRALKKCDGVLTVSESSKKLLVSVYGVEPRRVYVVPNIVDSEFFHPCDSRTHCDDPYILTVGSTWKHKNVTELLRMHECWASKYKLKIVAGAGQYSESLKKLASELRIEDRIELSSGLPATELRSLYQHCTALVYPSVMEGFGLPPLEAMSCGRPVIISDIALFRELYGDVPVYVRLGDIHSWVKAFAALEGYSAARIRSGVEHARSFSRPRMREALFGALEAMWNEDFRREVSKR